MKISGSISGKVKNIEAHEKRWFSYKKKCVFHYITYCNIVSLYGLT